MFLGFLGAVKTWLSGEVTGKEGIDVTGTTNDGRYLIIERISGKPSRCQMIDKSVVLTDSDCNRFGINPESENLCFLCCKMFSVRTLRHLDLEEGYFIHHSGSQIGICKSRGCIFCLFLQGRKGMMVRQAQDHTHVVINRGDKRRLWAAYLNSVSEPFEHFHLFTSEDDPAARFELTRAPNTDDTNEIATAKVKRWVSECYQNHSACSGKKIPELPRRVIDVHKMCLHINESGEIARYATLSYCWGKDQCLKTTKFNLPSIQRDLSFNSLPKTIQDAVLVTKQVGLRYLWVDALCIVQDDEIDKAFWINRMDYIYSHSTVCIGAAVAKSVSEGFLRRRPPPDSIKLPFDYEQQEGQGHVWAVYGDFYSKPAPLEKRAWTFQEISLAPRVLMYTEKGLLWMCDSSVWEPVIANEFLSHNISAPLRPSFFDQMLSSGRDSRRDILRSWCKAVEAYMNREITFPSDRLPAFAGIAARFYSIRKDRYLAGLWHEDLELQLAWFRDSESDRQNRRQIEDYQAPSWSWSPAMGRISYRNHYSGPYTSHTVVLISCHVETLVETASFGKVKGGFLEVEALTFPLENLPLKWQTHTVMDEDGKAMVIGQKDNIYCMVLGFRKPIHSSLHLRAADAETKEYGDWEGIFISRIGSNTDQKFRRVGFFSTRGRFRAQIPSSEAATANVLPLGAVRRRLTII